MAYYDPSWDAPNALALGGIGALGGLGISLLIKKQRKNKLRNAVVGATLLPLTYLGSKWALSKFVSDPEKLYEKDPIFNTVARPIYDKLWEKSVKKVYRENPDIDMDNAKDRANDDFLKKQFFLALGSYGALAGGVALPSAYCKYLRDKKLREEDPETLEKEEEMRRRLEQWFYGR